MKTFNYHPNKEGQHTLDDADYCTSELATATSNSVLGFLSIQQNDSTVSPKKEKFTANSKRPTPLHSNKVQHKKGPTMATMVHKRPRAVYFTNVEIVELPYTIGDNPSVSGGVPISASWISQKRTSLDLEFFEQYRPPRRDKGALHLTKEARLELMLQNGHTHGEIQLASEEAARIRQERLETIREMKQKLKTFMSRGNSQNDRICREGSSSPTMPSFHAQQLPPSPIVPRKSPVRTEPFPHLQFPQCPRVGVNSPHQRRKRPVPLDLGDDLFHGGDSLTSDIYNSTPKRLRSPRKENEKQVLSPRQENDFCSRMRLPARVKSPHSDCRPPIVPRRFASPPQVALAPRWFTSPPHPSTLSQRSPQHPRTM